MGRTVRDELQGAAPFEDGAFEVALARTVAFGVDRRNLAVQGEAFERFGAAFAEASGEALAEVALGGKGFISQTTTGAEAAGITSGRGHAFAGAKFGEVPGNRVGVVG